MSYTCCTIFLDEKALVHYQEALCCCSLEQALKTLARSIIPGILQSVKSAQAIILKTTPRPALGIIGTFDALEVARLKLQLRSLPLTCQRLRYVDTRATIAVCEKLAEQLVQRYGEANLRQFGFIGIPRGGLIVLGMLSYILNLKSTQLTPPFPQVLPLVVVDDCILSGSRISHFLQQQQHANLILATLFAHPDCRDAIVAREERVLSCLSGDDLQDYGSELMGANYASWKQQNFQRLEGVRYWIGLPDYLCFPWNEPDYLLWNGLNQHYEKSWRIIPADYCLKNRISWDVSILSLQAQQQFLGTIQPCPDIVFAEQGDMIVIGQALTGATYCLRDHQAVQWRTLMKSEFESEASISVDAELYAFYKILQEKGILEIKTLQR